MVRGLGLGWARDDRDTAGGLGNDQSWSSCLVTRANVPVNGNRTVPVLGESALVMARLVVQRMKTCLVIRRLSEFEVGGGTARETRLDGTGGIRMNLLVQPFMGSISCMVFVWCRAQSRGMARLSLEDGQRA